jgi:hypothetical protein
LNHAILFVILAAGLGVPVLAQAPAELQKRFDEAQRQIVRLPPADFKELPRNLIQELERRKCTIPQEAESKPRHNVIRGEFEKPGQIGWAVLCSVARPAEIARAEDRKFLQDLGGDVIGFSRKISAVGKPYIMKQHRTFGGRKPPPIDHQGIDDAFVGKASTTHYYYKKKWYRLTGAD